jgi:hypothetical protein
MNPESRFWRKLRAKLPRGHITRIENSAAPGTPDVSFLQASDGREFWFELKQVQELPKRSTTSVFREGLRPEQILWIGLHWRYGGNAYVVAETPTEVFIIPGKYAFEFNAMTLAQLRHHSLTLEKVLEDPRVS